MTSDHQNIFSSGSFKIASCVFYILGTIIIYSILFQAFGRAFSSYGSILNPMAFQNLPQTFVPGMGGRRRVDGERAGEMLPHPAHGL